VDEAEEILDVIFPSGDKAAEVVQPCKEPLDFPALAVAAQFAAALTTAPVAPGWAEPPFWRWRRWHPRTLLPDLAVSARADAVPAASVLLPAGRSAPTAGTGGGTSGMEDISPASRATVPRFPELRAHHSAPREYHATGRPRLSARRIGHSTGSTTADCSSFSSQRPVTALRGYPRAAPGSDEFASQVFMRLVLVPNRLARAGYLRLWAGYLRWPRAVLGGLFDERPETQTRVWDVFVFILNSMNSGPKARSGFDRETQDESGQCPSGCANPKGCTNLAVMATCRDFQPGFGLTRTIHSGYEAVDICKIIYKRRIATGEVETPLASTSFPQGCGTGDVGGPGAEIAQSGGPKPSGAIDSKRVDRLTKASFTLPVGPLRCLAMISSACPSSSGSPGL
jgi:hypothetical protein